MSVIQSIYYDSWEEFKVNFTKDLGYNSNVDLYENILFRGQGNANYRLESTFDRMFSNRSADEKKSIENDLILKFKKECEGRINAFSTYSYNTILSLARHHYVPTRLLDWSISPYIAAYFAFSSGFSSNNVEDGVAIFAYKRNNSFENSGMEIIDVSNEYNSRQLNQMGKYTKLNTFHNTIEEFLLEAERHIKVKDTILYKMMLPISEAKVALLDLNLMGINASLLIGDYDGYAQTATLNCLINLK